ncbi:MAG: hypothetical protein GWO04_02400, partial [Actinobacteria bacterium]|nr:hypothetical protein [Actinomycetota bacterium]NIW30631.1 hypothetical protein [Actinomycetota bacterium]
MSLAPLDARWLSAWLPLIWLAASGEPPAPAPAGAEPVIEEQVEVTAPLPAERDIAAFATRIGAGEASSRGADLADLL